MLHYHGIVANKITYQDADISEAYYNKWNNFFNNNPNFPKLTKAAISSLNVNEGCIESDEIKLESSGSEGYLSHFIYTSIDTPFSKGKMNKDIFVFEHFKDKIIPVGYLASDKNTPKLYLLAILQVIKIHL